MAMEDFSFFFPMGWEHIMSWDALDHILFITALAVIFKIKQWQQVLVLVTAFTIGHFLTLWLSVAGHVQFSSNWVEFLIPMTIVATAISNFLKIDARLSLQVHYGMALGFGLIHGMGYANAIRFALTDEQSLGWSLFGFNIGLELGQILVVAGVLVAGVLVEKLGLKQKWWEYAISLVILGLSLQMTFERFPH